MPLRNEIRVMSAYKQAFGRTAIENAFLRTSASIDCKLYFTYAWGWLQDGPDEYYSKATCKYICAPNMDSNHYHIDTLGYEYFETVRCTGQVEAAFLFVDNFRNYLK